MNYTTEKDLKEVYEYIDEVDLAIKDKSRTTDDSVIASQITKGIATSGAFVGGIAIASAVEMLAPVAPVVFFGITGRMIGRFIKKKSEEEKMRKAKELAYKKAISKQNALIKALKEESNADKERIEYLVGLNQLLLESILKLQKELE